MDPTIFSAYGNSTHDVLSGTPHAEIKDTSAEVAALRAKVEQKREAAFERDHALIMLRRGAQVVQGERDALAAEATELRAKVNGFTLIVDEQRASIKALQKECKDARHERDALAINGGRQHASILHLEERLRDRVRIAERACRDRDELARIVSRLEDRLRIVHDVCLRTSAELAAGVK
jgi:chromosome segregation ATPase